MSAGVVPLRDERQLRHEEMARELVRLVFGRFRLFGFVARVLALVEQQVRQLVCGGEDPALNRDPLPGVHDDGGAAIIFSHAEAEEGVALLVEQQDLDALVLQQAADVADRLLGTEADSPRTR